MTTITEQDGANLSILNKVDGSATLKTGPTMVICSVTGPIEAKSRMEIPTATALEIIVRPATGVAATRERLFEDKISTILSSLILRHLFPRTLIQIVIQVLQSGENSIYTIKELSVAINASYLALIDAGVPLRASFSATCLVITDSNEIIAEPDEEQISKAKSFHVIAFKIEEAKATSLLLAESNGSFTEEQFFKVLSVATDKCEEKHQSFRSVISEKLQKDYIWRY